MMVEMTHRFYPPVRAAREIIRSGRIGRITAVEDRVNERVAPERSPPWIFEHRRAGGGVALSEGVHLLDRVSWVCGQGLVFRDGLAGYGEKLGDVDDAAAFFLTLAGGAPASVLTAFQRRGGSEMDDELTIYGTDGTLRVWAWRGWRLERFGEAPEEHAGYAPEADLYSRVRVGMAGALAEFASAIEENRTPAPTPDDVLASHEIIEQFYSRVGSP